MAKGRKKRNIFIPKAICQRSHAKKRALERYGVELNRHKLREMVTLIQQCKCRLIKRQSLRVCHYLVNFEGTTFRLCYDQKRQSIITFLPVEDATLSSKVVKEFQREIDTRATPNENESNDS